MKTNIKIKKIISQSITPFAGKWIALIDGQVIESATSLDMLMMKVRRTQLHKKPSIMLVPRKDEGPYIL
ncbi:MAG: DUF5678 domain-containing protein [Patescibacteria group bacterium]